MDLTDRRRGEGLLVETRLSIDDMVLLSPTNRNRVMRHTVFDAEFTPFVETPPPPPPPVVAPEKVPTLPWTGEEIRFGDNLRLTKRFPDGSYGEIMNDEEVAMWASVKALLELNESRTSSAEVPSGESSADSVPAASDGQADGATKSKRPR